MSHKCPRCKRKTFGVWTNSDGESDGGIYICKKCHRTTLKILQGGHLYEVEVAIVGTSGPRLM